MIIRPAASADFNHLETFVWQAIFPAFDVDGLSPEQRAENDELVESARTEVIAALDRDGFSVFVAIDPKLRRLAGYVIADGRPRSYAEIPLIIVKKAYWGKGVAHQLLKAALTEIGKHRAVSVAVRYYNDRAKAFFAKYDFEDSGEMAGDHAIPRSLLLREAAAESAPAPAAATAAAQTLPPKGPSLAGLSFSQASIDPPDDDFPTLADEPVFEELPDYRLTTDDDEPLFATGANALSQAPEEAPLFEETTLDDKTLTELEAFIARAKAKKAGQEADPTPGSTSARPSPPEPAVTSPSPKERQTEAPTEAPPGKDGDQFSSSFEFSFADLPQSEPELSEASEVTVKPSNETLQPTEDADRDEAASVEESQRAAEAPAADPAAALFCTNCGTALPQSAKFCFNCGSPQVVDGRASAAEKAEAGHGAAAGAELEWEVLELPDLDDPAAITTVDPLDPAPDEPENRRVSAAAEATSNPPVVEGPVINKAESHFTLAGLKSDFRALLSDRVTRYFGERRVERFIMKLEVDREFQQVRDSSLASLHRWLSDHPAHPDTVGRIQNIQAGLVEYFLVETARDLHGDAFPQKLLRHQSADWASADLFRLVMDYLSFEDESERVHTDFISMPARALKNATSSFLHAVKDERILFICDQSLISQAKNGFALTDTALYWKNIFQPAGQANYHELTPPRVEGGHVIINGRYFDAGASLNLKMALLLDRLRLLVA